MLARYLHISKENDIYENHRSKPYKETEIGVRVHAALRLQTLYAETLPDYFIKGGWALLQVHSRGTFHVRAYCQPMGEPVSMLRDGRASEQARAGSQAHHGQFGHTDSHRCDRKGPSECHESQRTMGGSHRQGGLQKHIQIFFISLGARFGRIRKTTKGTASPQLYAYKKDKLQKLVRQYDEGRIDLYYGDGSFICTECYVPYGWLYPWKNITIASENKARLKKWGMATKEATTTGTLSWRA